MKTVKDICQEYGYSQTELGKRFGIPLRTVQNWHGGQREPAPYVVHMMEEILRAEQAAETKVIMVAEWRMQKYPLTQCTACGVTRNCENDVGWKYCPECGAKMDGESEDTE